MTAGRSNNGVNQMGVSNELSRLTKVQLKERNTSSVQLKKRNSVTGDVSMRNE